MLDRPERHNPRLSSFDYHSRGAYFITICTYKRVPHFEDPMVEYLLVEQWYKLPQRFPTVALDEFGAMPDHVHFILWLGAREGYTPLSLARVIGAWKSLTAVAWLRYTKSLGFGQPRKLWQDRYYDHIIRNEQDLAEKRRYIQNNPLVAQLKKEGEHN